MRRFLEIASIVIIPVLAAIALGFYAFHFKDIPISEDPGAWGQFGDYMGGVLNPIVAFGALLWLVTSVRIQKQELSETRKALEESQKAQREQADTTLLAAQISSLNIKLSSVVNQLSHLREQQMRISDLQNRPDRPRVFVDEHHKEVSVQAKAGEIAGAIQSLMGDEADVLQKIEETSSKFKPDVYATYSNPPPKL